MVTVNYCSSFWGRRPSNKNCNQETEGSFCQALHTQHLVFRQWAIMHTKSQFEYKTSPTQYPQSKRKVESVVNMTKRLIGKEVDTILIWLCWTISLYPIMDLRVAQHREWWGQEWGCYVHVVHQCTCKKIQLLQPSGILWWLHRALCMGNLF